MPSEEINISKHNLGASLTAPTPVNTPLVTAPISQGLSRPTVPDIPEHEGGSDAGDDIMARLAGLIGTEVDFLESLPRVVRKRVEGLKGVQTQYSKMEIQYRKELMELDKKYLGLYNPLFKRRHEILTGAAEPTDAEVTAGEAQTAIDDPELTKLADIPEDTDEKKDIKGIPDFWLTALKNHVGISPLITERDEEALKHLTDIRFEFLEAPKHGYKLSFHFSPNNFFDEEVLTKTYNYEEELSYSGEPVYGQAEGSEIHWKENMDLTKEIETRKQRNKNTNRTRVIQRVKTVPSFFRFFSPPAPPKMEDLATGDVDEGELTQTQEQLELDYQIGEDLKDKIIPRAIDYYTGKALEYDVDDEDDDEDDMVFDDEDIFDSGSEDEDEIQPRKKVTKDADNVEPGECKTQ
ncbi:hypothetical protein FRC03_008643 [Tulasnella sp. 419]|nr:hypothetical protein FRC02_000211 [Tulasnella sp. 418]KAG8970446.1 hypothetical protein FRC03_008643 [Tulasnella sp. 419]